MDQSAAILAELQAIRQQNDRLLALLLAKKPRKSRRAVHDDDALLARLLPVIAAGIGDRGRNFTVSEAVAFIRSNDAALFARVCRDLDGDVHKRLGCLLRRAVGRQVAGLTIHRIGEDKGRVMWQTKLVSGAHETPITNLAA